MALFEKGNSTRCDWCGFDLSHEWQPIDTAPVNESVLVFIPSPTAEHYGPAIYRGLQVEVLGRRIWKVTGLHFGSDCGTSNHPSHWMPLPDPPEVSDEV